MPRRSGFTLVELLVSVSIIALLVAILIPAVKQARDSAKVLLCATNLRQIGIAWNVYLSSNDDTFPSWEGNMQWFYGGREPSIASASFWVLDYRPLNPYVTLSEQDQEWAELFRCPADRQILNDKGQPAVSKGYPTYEYYGNSYPMNWLLLIPYDQKNEQYLYGKNFRLNDVEVSHSRLMLAGDCQWYYTVNDATWDAHFHNRHDQMNLAFLDGHVAFTQLIRGEAQTAEYSIIPWPVAPSEED